MILRIIIVYAQRLVCFADNRLLMRNYTITALWYNVEKALILGYGISKPHLFTEIMKNIIKRTIAVLIFLLLIIIANLIGFPGYIAGLLFAVFGSNSLLRGNQNGVIREKLALAGAALGSLLCYCVFGLIYGAYAAAAAFLLIGMGLTRLYKSGPGIKQWLFEAVPAALYFCLFERFGGAVSGLQGMFVSGDFGSLTRFLESAVLLAGLIVFEIICLHKQKNDCERPSEAAKLRGLRVVGRIVVALVIVSIWLNPAAFLVFDNIKNAYYDSFSLFSAERSRVSAVSDTNGTTLLDVSDQPPVYNQQDAADLIDRYDKLLEVEYRFLSSEKMVSGNVIYKFVQVSGGMEVNGGNKNLIVAADGKPIFVIGEPKLGAKNFSVPADMISQEQAAQHIVDRFGESTVIEEPIRRILNQNRNGGYDVVYKLSISTYEDEKTYNCNVLVDSKLGIIDISSIQIDGEAYGVMTEIAELIRESGEFSDEDHDAIFGTVNAATAGIVMNPWMYLDLTEKETRNYYTAKGDPELGERNASAVREAYSEYGVTNDNNDESVTLVETKIGGAAVQGNINYTDDNDSIIITHNGVTTQQFTVSTKTPVTIIITKSNGETLLTAPVYDEETFEIYPAEEDEEYIVTVQDGVYQTDDSSAALPGIPGSLAELSEAFWDDWFNDTAVDSYTLSIKQLAGDLRVPNGTAIDNALAKITESYNTGNGSRFAALYRFDDVNQSYNANHHDVIASHVGTDMANTLGDAIKSKALGFYVQSLLVYYRLYNNGAFGQPGQNFPELGDLSQFVAADPDKTFMAFVLFGLQGGIENWGANLTTDLMDLKDSDLALKYIGSEAKDNKTYISVDAEITRGGVTLMQDRITLMLQHFGDAPAAGGNWFTAFFDGMKSMFTAGDYLGVDLSGQTVAEQGDLAEWRIVDGI
jgi:hypothetical protein